MTESSAKDTAPTVATPTVVATKTAVTLADHLNLRELPLATTPGGKVFSLKALHPADHEIKVSRVPGGNKMSVAVNCDMVETIPIVNANAEVGITVPPHPLVPCSVEIKDGGTTKYYGFLNAAFGGSVVQNLTTATLRATFRNNFVASVESYRITSQSVTVELIAPSLSDQGTITACQYHLPPKTSGFSDIDSNSIDVHPEVWVYEPPVTPSKMVLGTSAYTAKAREGAYLPLKLTDFSWQRTNDSVYNFDYAGEVAAQGTMKILFDHSNTFPYYLNRGGLSALNDLVPEMKCCGDNFGFIAMTGMAANVAVRIRVRQTLEISGYPSSTYAPLMEIALPPDEVALKMYFEVSNRCKDAYPASYNDLAKLKNVVSSIAKGVLPFVEPALSLLSNAPGVPGMIGKAGKALLPTVQGFSRAAEQTPDSAWSGKSTGGKKGKQSTASSGRAKPKAGGQASQKNSKGKASKAKPKTVIAAGSQPAMVLKPAVDKAQPSKVLKPKRD